MANEIPGHVEVIPRESHEIQPAQARALVHPLSATCLIALDGISGGGELLATPTGVGVIGLSLLVGLICFLAVTMIESGVNKKPLTEALGVGLALGVLAGVPYPVAGTATGLAILGWSGLKHLSAR